MRALRRIAVMVLLGGWLASHGLAEGADWAGDGWGTRSAYGRLYNPSTVETIRGEVLRVETVTPMEGMGPGIDLVIETGREAIPVHLGPSWFLERQDVQFRPTEWIEVTGSRVNLMGHRVLLAAEVRKGDQVLVLRNENGVPAWAGWRRAGRGEPMKRGLDGAEGRPGSRTMMEQHRKEAAARDAELKDRVAAMNAAQGDAKVVAMAAVINQLVEDRLRMREQMTGMHQEREHKEGADGGAEPSGNSGASGPAIDRAVELRIPSVLVQEHESLQAELKTATQAGGQTEVAAKVVEARLLAHFREENEIALPLLGILRALATGPVHDGMRSAISMGKALEGRLATFLREHDQITAALQQFEQAAQVEGKTAQVEFARRLRLHALTEEQVFYPAAILVGKFLATQLSPDQSDAVRRVEP